MTDTDPLLNVADLQTKFDTREGTVHAVDGVSFTVEEGEIVGIVGESGSGKSVSALSLVRLEDPGHITNGSIRFKGTEMTEADDRTIQRIRGDGMAMVFQDPMETLNPVFPVGEQIEESLKVHDDQADQRLLDYLHVPLFSDRSERAERRERVTELMEQVGIPYPGERIDDYPHEFSGGMRQRAMLAIALAREPDLLIADEPTTALDVTIQAAILDRLKELNENLGMSIVLISHDFGVIAEICDKVLVMYGGEIMEAGSTEQVLTDPQHPYTRALLECMPQNTPRKEPLRIIDGQVPNLLDPEPGCMFAPRCPHATDACVGHDIDHIDCGDDHSVACCHLDAIEGDAGVERGDAS
ncbi:ABC transporter ATP-binding protein [Halomicrococcus sp. SG-WS-1]|uniref:ABC transporter ATP-binding protein n=1 Tax=Halomicrococcus sp. SG-WS-1 TaxID=3439057 RepID=UPI003F7ABD77